TGVMGGKVSHEFMVPAETGESEVAYCESGDYAANVEKAVSRVPSRSADARAESAETERFATPGVVTIEALASAPYNVAAAGQIKTLVYLVQSKLALILLRGDHQLNEAKLAAALGTTEFRPATEEEIVPALGARPGSLGAVRFKALQVYADEVLRGATGM